MKTRFRVAPIRNLILIHIGLFVLILAVIMIVTGDFVIAGAILLGALAILVSGGLTAYFYFKRGKVYEKRGESGPDG